MQFQNSETFRQGHILFFAVSVSLNRSMDFAAILSSTYKCNFLGADNKQ